ncbi:agmatine hydroxycinnamoyltransferase 1-like [Curcuma longa]|uniref:agmatine hydroxycinnamoyltransferase 1-like n=1 Tax=Curcuma longa TaxID=136217 RepID=UPI003D9E0EFB
MEVRVKSSRLVKPIDFHSSPSTGHVRIVPLNVFDKVTMNLHVAVIFLFRPPPAPPSNAHLDRGLAVALSYYREFAGRLAADGDGNPVIVLNDAGALFVEATTELPLPLEPSPALRRFLPSTDGGDAGDAVAQVQLTRFACGSLAVGFSWHHRVADGHAAGNFLVAWGIACRGMPLRPPFRDRSAVAVLREPLEIRFDHRNTEYYLNADDDGYNFPIDDDVTMVKVHFTPEFVADLRTESEAPTKFEAVAAQLWRAATRARGLSERETTHLVISVDGRRRTSPPIPGEYFGNLVLWAVPRTSAGDLVRQPLRHAASIIREEIAKIDAGYFRSFVDFAGSGAVEAEKLVPAAEREGRALWPGLDVASWLRLPFSEVDFGGGRPFQVTPAYVPVEGLVAILPGEDGGVDAYVNMFDRYADNFRRFCRRSD